MHQNKQVILSLLFYQASHEGRIYSLPKLQKSRRVTVLRPVCLGLQGLFIWEVGRDVCRDGMFFIPAFNTIYMAGGTGRFSSQMFLYPRDNFPRDNFQSQHNIVPAKFFLYKRNGINRRYISHFEIAIYHCIMGLFWGTRTKEPSPKTVP